MGVLNNIFVIALIVLSGLFVFMLLVIIHELWHFIAAKKSWVKVLEFGIGIPPKACKLWTDKSWTEYTLNRIPLGWFVRLKWEDPKVPEEFNAKDSLIKAPIHKKIIIMLAWITMNLIFARLMFTLVFWIWTKPISVVPENVIEIENTSLMTPSTSYLEKNWLISWDVHKSVIVEEVLAWWLGKSIWLNSWYKIISINNQNVDTLNISKTLKENIDKKGEIVYQTDKWETISTWLTCITKSCELWIIFLWAEVKELKFPLNQAMLLWLKEIRAQANISLYSLWKIGKWLISFNRNEMNNSVNKLSWPVLITKIIWTLFLWKEWTKLLWLAGLISFALALFNVLPIPALDWWRVLSSIIQRAWRFKAEKYFNIEWYINLVFFILLLALGVYVMLKDSIKLWLHIPFLG